MMLKHIRKCLFFILIVFELNTNAQAFTNAMSAYPNPFINRTLISYSIATADTISIFIYNQLGQSILSLQNNHIVSSGAYQDSLIMDTYRAGIYFLICLNKQQKKLMNLKIIKTLETDVKELVTDLPVKYYPNPFNDKLNIDYEGTASQNATLRVCNFLGEEIYYSKSLNSKAEIDFTNLSSGMYFITFQLGLEQKVYKILKE